MKGGLSELIELVYEFSRNGWGCGKTWSRERGKRREGERDRDRDRQRDIVPEWGICPIASSSSFNKNE
jgi:hypothetical protein